ncbi:MAG: cyclase family protein [Nitrospinota bacterium]
MPREMIDLSVPLHNGTFDDMALDIQYIAHEENGRRWAKRFGVEVSDLPYGHGSSSEKITLMSHCGTHIDAPYHYAPTNSEGKPARTIDMLELKHFFSDAFCLDFTHRKPAQRISPSEIEKALKTIQYTVKAGDIALIHTGATRYYNSPKFLDIQPGLTRESVFYLVDRGVKVIGIDAWGLDIPFSAMARELKEGIQGTFWQSHFAGKEKEYFQIEKLANLDKLPRPHGFQVACFPVLIERASGAWCRAVAIFED